MGFIQPKDIPLAETHPVHPTDWPGKLDMDPVGGARIDKWGGGLQELGNNCRGGCIKMKMRSVFGTCMVRRMG